MVFGLKLRIHPLPELATAWLKNSLKFLSGYNLYAHDLPDMGALANNNRSFSYAVT